MRPARTFLVHPSLPEKLQPLQELAINLYWSWHGEAAELFSRLDPGLWEESGHNPILLLQQLKQEQLEAAAKDPGYTAQLELVLEQYRHYLDGQVSRCGWQSQNGFPERITVAYFSAEFGLTECLPIYAGGLGFLAGDHLKSASDLGISLVGVGLLYREGYFRQRLDNNGWQQESYPQYDFYGLPLQPCRQRDGTQLVIELEYPECKIKARVWKAEIGRVPLLLLDTDWEGNCEQERRLTSRLYGGDLEMRIQQEIMLGIGGMRTLDALGLEPAICHLNEGHSAFSGLERIRLLSQRYGLTFAEARELVAASNVFTTHTPVPAGIDLFPPYLIDKYFTNYYQSLGLSRQEFFSLGRKDPLNQQEPFNMAVLALRLSSWANGVSQLHGTIARRMWQSVWPGVPEAEIPLTAITNGVHAASWVAPDLAELYDQYLGLRWRTDPDDPEAWARVEQIPDEELWRIHERLREQLVAFVRQRLRAQLIRRGAPQTEIQAAGRVLNPEALTVGFARRFAVYKRGTLLLHNLERLAAILQRPGTPLQIICAGKAHPEDEAGKKLIQQIVQTARLEDFRPHLVFIEDYDANVARYLIRGCDIWLNTPRRPLEASGTSGMKAALNGVLHVSTLDGWWAEAYEEDKGWAIGTGEIYNEADYQDAVEAQALYDLLEKEIVPLFYDRGGEGLPRRWIARIKAAIQGYAPRFNTHRMVKEYADKFYRPAVQLYQKLKADNFQGAKSLVAWKNKLRENWPKLKIEKIEDEIPDGFKVGDNVEVRAQIKMGDLEPEDVKVEAYYGPVNAQGEIAAGQTVTLTCLQPWGEGSYLFTGVIPCRNSGRQGYSLRILPRHEDLAHPYISNLILWS